MRRTDPGVQQLITAKAPLPGRGIAKRRRLVPASGSAHVPCEITDFSIQNREFLFKQCTNGAYRVVNTAKPRLIDPVTGSADIFADFNGIRYEPTTGVAYPGIDHLITTRPMGLSMQEVTDDQTRPMYNNPDMAIQIGGTASVYNNGSDAFSPGDAVAVLPWPADGTRAFAEFKKAHQPLKGCSGDSKRGLVKRVDPSLIHAIQIELRGASTLTPAVDLTDSATMQTIWKDLTTNQYKDPVQFNRAVRALHAYYTTEYYNAAGSTAFDDLENGANTHNEGTVGFRLRVITLLLESTWLDAARLLATHTRGIAVSSAGKASRMDVVLTK